MESWGSLPASSGSPLTLLGPPPLFSACPVPGVSQAGMAGMLARRGWEEVAQGGERELVRTPSKGDSFPSGLCLGVSDSVTEFYFWQLLSASSRPQFLGLSIPGWQIAQNWVTPSLEESTHTLSRFRAKLTVSHRPCLLAYFLMLLKFSNAQFKGLW